MKNDGPESQISIFDYDNYRTFLNDIYMESKAKHAKFSFRYFAKAAGFASPSALKRIIDGERNLSLEAIRKFSEALKLNKEEALFFHNLVLLNQAKTSEDQKLYAEQLLSSKSYKKIHPLHISQFNYFSKWYFIPIRELISLPQFKEDPEWISQNLCPAISAAEAKGALEDLLNLGLIDRDASGRLKQTETTVSANGLLSPSLTSFHKQMAQKAGESIDRFSRDVREISSITFPLSEDACGRIKEIVTKCRNEIIGVVTEDKGQNRIYQLNFYLFPLTEKVVGKKGE